MDSGSDHSNSPSVDVAAAAAGGGGGVGSEDFVHVDNDASGTDSSCFGEASMVGSEWRGEGNDDFLSRSGIGADTAGVGGNGGGTAGGEDDEGRKELPEALSRKILKLTCESTAAEGGICDVYLVGTAHVSTVWTIYTIFCLHFSELIIIV